MDFRGKGQREHIIFFFLAIFHRHGMKCQMHGYLGPAVIFQIYMDLVS